MIFQVVLVLFLAVVRIDTQSDCTGLPDGPCCAGCHSYTLCTDGVGEIVDCLLPDYAYNELIGGCDLMENTPPPCGKNRNCRLPNGTVFPNGKYPDMTPGQECEYFFTCSNGVNLGANSCNPPNSTDLVFHYALQLCNWRSDVPAPCGTYGVSPPPLI